MRWRARSSRSDPSPPQSFYPFNGSSGQTKNPQQRKEVRHLPARAHPHLHPNRARPVSRSPITCGHTSQPRHPRHEQAALALHPPSIIPTQQTLHNKSPSTHTPNQPFTPRDIPSHPTPRMKHQSSPPAMLDGTGLLQMPPQT